MNDVCFSSWIFMVSVPTYCSICFLWSNSCKCAFVYPQVKYSAFLDHCPFTLCPCHNTLVLVANWTVSGKSKVKPHFSLLCFRCTSFLARIWRPPRLHLLLFLRLEFGSGMWESLKERFCLQHLHGRSRRCMQLRATWPVLRTWQKIESPYWKTHRSDCAWPYEINGIINVL